MGHGQLSFLGQLLACCWWATAHTLKMDDDCARNTWPPTIIGVRPDRPNSLDGVQLLLCIEAAEGSCRLRNCFKQKAVHMNTILLTAPQWTVDWSVTGAGVEAV